MISTCKAVETDSNARLSIVQSSSSNEMFGHSASAQSYNYFDHPTLNAIPLAHSITRIDFTNVREVDGKTNPVVRKSSFIGDNFNNATLNMQEFDQSANSHAEYLIKMDYEQPYVIENANHSKTHLVNGTKLSGDWNNLDDQITSTVIMNGFDANNYTISGVNTALVNIGTENWNENIRLIDNNAINLTSTGLYYVNTEYWVYDFEISFNIQNFQAESILLNIKNSTFNYRISILNSNDVEIYSEEKSSNTAFSTTISYSNSMKSLRIRSLEAISYTAITAFITIDCMIAYNNRCSLNLEFQNRQSLSLLAGKLARIQFKLASWTHNTLYQFACYANDVMIYYEDRPSMYGGHIIESFTYNANVKVNFTFTPKSDASGNRIAIIAYDYIYESCGYLPINASSIEVDNLQYSVFGNDYTQNDITNLLVYSHTQNDVLYQNKIRGTILYQFTSAVFSEYNSQFDLYSPTQTIEIAFRCYNFTNPNYIDISVCTNSFEYRIPSEINLKCNNLEVADRGIGIGLLYFSDYQTVLDFDADLPVSFDFKIESSFTYEFELEIRSPSYLYKQLTLSNYHGINLTKLEFLFNSSLIYASVNNYEFTSKIYSTNLNIDGGSFIKIIAITSEFVHLPLDSTSFTQISSNVVSSDSNVLFREIFSATRTFSRWFIEKNNVNSLRLSRNSNLISYTSDGTRYFFTQSLVQTNTITADWGINPHFNVSYEVISITEYSAQVKISYNAQIAVNNVTIQLSLPFLLLDWDCGFQNENRILSIPNIDFTPTIQTIYAYGTFPDPTHVEFDNFRILNNIIIEPNFEKQMQLQAEIKIPEPNFLFQFPIEADWTDIHVFDSNQVYQLNNDNITFHEWTTSKNNLRINFTCNPILSYTQERINNSLILTIESRYSLQNVIVLFSITTKQSYKIQNASAYKYVTQGETDYYWFIANLDAGENLIQINLRTFDGMEWWVYLLIFGGLGAGIYVLLAIQKRFTAKKRDKS
jgi:hypothetical protein